jgi:hypothetical protein
MVNLVRAAMLVALLGIPVSAQRGPMQNDQMEKLQKAMTDAQAKAARPGDDALTCDALQNEIVTSMRDPVVTATATRMGAWSAEQQRKMDEASSASKGTMAGQMAMGLASSLGSMFVPGLSMFTGRAQAAAAQAQAAQASADAARNMEQIQERMNDMIPILPQMMRGQRLMQLAQARKCDWVAGAAPSADPSGAGLPPR